MTSQDGRGKSWRGIWVVAEQRKGELLPVGLEIVGEARRLAERLETTVAAIVIGSSVGSRADELIARGADRVFVADAPSLARYDCDAYASIVVELVGAEHPQILLMGATALGRDLAPAIAARLTTGLCADCTALGIDEAGRLLQIAPVLGGKELATMLCPVARPQMATVRPGVFRMRPREERRGEVVAVAVLPVEQPRVVMRRMEAMQVTGGRLTEADIVIAGGAGVGGAEGWALIREFAALLGAAVGGTRPPMDDGYLREDQMIGQSGVTVRPKLYFAIGISGDIQHTVGFENTGIVVAINSDPKAPIFKVADYGIVGDFREVVPLLMEAIRPSAAIP